MIGAGIRWFELRKTSRSDPVPGGYAGAHGRPHRWMGTIAINNAGNIALGYSVSSDTVFPSIRYVDPGASDPPGR